MDKFLDNISKWFSGLAFNNAMMILLVLQFPIGSYVVIKYIAPEIFKIVQGQTAEAVKETAKSLTQIHDARLEAQQKSAESALKQISDSFRQETTNNHQLLMKVLKAEDPNK